jgi:PAS domain S-box-containing protein
MSVSLKTRGKIITALPRPEYRLLIFTVLAGISFIILLLYLAYTDVKNVTITEFNKQQMLLARQGASGIEAAFKNIESALNHFSTHHEVVYLNRSGKNLLQRLLDDKSNLITSVTRVDHTGRIIWSTSGGSSVAGRDISSQKHICYLLETKKVSVSDVFTSVQGLRIVAIHIPVLDNGRFAGSLGISIDFEKLASAYLENIKIGNNGYAWVISKEGTEIFCPVPGHPGNSIYRTSGQFPSVIAMAERMMRGESGTAVYEYDAVKDKTINIIRKHAAFAPVNLMNTWWSIVVATPENDILSTLIGFRNTVFIIIAVFVLISGLILFFAARYLRLSGEIESRKKIEKVLRDSGEDLRITLNSITDGVIALSTSGLIRTMNPVAEKLTGWADSEAGGMKFRDVVNIVDSCTGENLGDRYLHPDVSSSYDIGERGVSLISSDGTRKNIMGSFSPIINSDGITVGTVFVFRDITDKLKMEEQLIQAQKMETIGQLAGGIAHDFNNILASILSSAEILTLKYTNDDKAQKFLGFIKDTAIRAAGLTDKLLDFSRMNVKRTESVDVNDAAHRVIEILEHSLDRSITIKSDIAAESPVITGDPSQVQSIILNLSVNARDAMPNGGTLTITTSNVIIDKEFPVKAEFSFKPGIFVMVEVADTGEGINPAMQLKIFEPFFSTKPPGKGTGLGLSVVYGAVRDHGGIIDLISEEGKGTDFRIYLPVSAGAKKIMSEKKDGIIHGKGTILIAEDEPSLRSLMTDILTELGYTVMSVPDGGEAVSIFREKSDDLDIVILDMIMPGMNGRDVMIECIKIKPGQKIILCSGYSMNIDMSGFMDSENIFFLRKPVTVSSLSHTIARALGTEV